MTLAIQNEDEHVPAKHFTEEQLNLIKNHICKGANNDELAYFLQVCKKTGLDPFSKQIYSVPRGGARTIQVGIDGLRLIADRTGRYVPGREPTYTYDKHGNLESATSYVKKQARDGTWHECASTAYWNEFNANQGLWKKMPRVMLAKCAESACLRKCFPGEMSGLYADDEMHQADENVKQLYTKQIDVKPETVTHQVTQTITTEQANELKNLHELCDPDFKDTVLKKLTSKGINGWSKVPVEMLEILTHEANENSLQYQTKENEEAEAPF